LSAWFAVCRQPTPGPPKKRMRGDVILQRSSVSHLPPLLFPSLFRRERRAFFSEVACPVAFPFRTGLSDCLFRRAVFLSNVLCILLQVVRGALSLILPFVSSPFDGLRYASEGVFRGSSQSLLSGCATFQEDSCPPVVSFRLRLHFFSRSLFILIFPAFLDGRGQRDGRQRRGFFWVG